MVNVAPVAVVCGTANGAFDAIGEPHIPQVLADCKVGGGREDALIGVGHGRIHLATALGLGLGANPMPLTVSSEERAAIADDLAVFVLTRRYRPLTVAALPLLGHLLLLSSR